MIPNEPDFLNYKKIENMELLGEYGFPKVKGIKIRHPENVDFIGFNYATNPKTQDKEKQWVHFFLPDYRFQQVWNNPQSYIDCFKQYKGILSPDFSCYIGMPKAMQIFNVYRMAFLSAYYQRFGIHVLPSLTWGEPDTFKWCFDWVPKHSAVVVSTLGCMQNKETIKFFMKGFEKACEIVEPYQVIIYGKVNDDVMKVHPDITRVQTFLEKRREAGMRTTPKEWKYIPEVAVPRLEKRCQ